MLNRFSCIFFFFFSEFRFVIWWWTELLCISWILSLLFTAENCVSWWKMTSSEWFAGLHCLYCTPCKWFYLVFCSPVLNLNFCSVPFSIRLLLNFPNLGLFMSLTCANRCFSIWAVETDGEFSYEQCLKYWILFCITSICEWMIAVLLPW